VKSHLQKLGYIPLLKYFAPLPFFPRESVFQIQQGDYFK